jgi:hypothetical protein
LERRLERGLQRRELITAADEAREAPRTGDIEAGPQGTRTLEPEDPRRVAHALELELTEVAQGEKSVDSCAVCPVR